MVGVCDRCERRPVELNKLQFKTEERETEIHLCNICFNAARQLWKGFLDYSTKDRKKEKQ